ncbi:hypothetical protein MIND_00661100 [Mycena indigotica]|uniref:Uncharacterized protein n=1 Tax=Mycena indigotica TaxID=2126181 RepID=A0A8H6SJS2_9AGAR|nr:uncharacterized protein MIND_00661100 [Mycena indigotica]KAF7300980.1 hypothetical protein MIND_00661100 [Mycena indigotica]
MLRLLPGKQLRAFGKGPFFQSARWRSSQNHVVSISALLLNRRHLPSHLDAVAQNGGSVARRQPYSTQPADGAPNPSPMANMSEEEALLRIERIESLGDVFHTVPHDSPERLAAAYLLLCEVLAYLSRHGEEAPAYISIFTNTAVPADSDVARARKAIFTTTKLTAQILGAVGASSKIREANASAFALHGALDALFVSYRGPSDDGELPQWVDFWNRAQPIVVELARVLDDSRDTFMEPQTKKDE